MKRHSFFCGVALLAAVAAGAVTPEELFRNPPPEAHAGVWWHWMGAQVTEEGIRKDLDWFRRTGITSATVFGMADSCTPWAKRIGKVPTDGLRPFDARWWKLFAFACREGKRRGIDIGLHNCPGYTSTGGAWIPSRLSMRELVFNVTNATKQISTASRADFPVFNEDTKRYERPPCPARQTDVVDIGSARGGVKVSHIPMGAFVQPADWDSFGLECDKMNPEAVDFHLDHVIGELKRHLGDDLPAAGLGHVLLDSYEAGTPSWTPHMREEFAKRRGYDPLEFLPIVGGMTNLYTAVEVQKFRADFDRTLKDLYRDVLFKRMYERLHAEGVKFSNEPYSGPFVSAEVAPYVDRIMTEFWFATNLTSVGTCGFNRFAAPGGGRHNVVEAEAFTGQPKNCEWVEMPANLKPATDAAFLAGVNRLILHTNPLQPWGDDVKPGVTMGRWGTHFGRNQTWAECGKAWFDYVARCQALLQWGEPSDKRLKLQDARQVARTDGTQTIYFVVTPQASRFYDDKADKWYDPVTGAEVVQTTLDKSRTLADFTPAVGDRSQSSDPVVRYFSGTQTYRTRFDLPSGAQLFVERASCPFSAGSNGQDARSTKWGARMVLSFGCPADQVFVVRVNGRLAGTAWCAPWEVALPVEALTEKGNVLEIDVTNSWRNRLIGDEQEPADCVFEKAPLPGGWFLREYPEWFGGGLANRPSRGRKCFTTWNYFTKDSKLLPSGLITPPTLMWKEK